MHVPPLVCLCFFPLGYPQVQRDWSLCCVHGHDYASYCENNNNNNNNNKTSQPTTHNARSSECSGRYDVKTSAQPVAHGIGLQHRPFHEKTDKKPDKGLRLTFMFWASSRKRRALFLSYFDPREDDNDEANLVTPKR